MSAPGRSWSLKASRYVCWIFDVKREAFTVADSPEVYHISSYCHAGDLFKLLLFDQPEDHVTFYVATVLRHAHRKSVDIDIH